MDKAEFWASKSPLPEWHAVAFEHPAFSAPFRLVANQFAPVTLGGYVHAPAAMSVKAPDSKGDVQPKLQLTFPRQVVGREFKKQLRLVTDSGSREPIRVTYAIYLGDAGVAEIEWRLYADDDGGVVFGTDTVQVTATDSNQMRQVVAPIYDPSVFTGLELI